MCLSLVKPGSLKEAEKLKKNREERRLVTCVTIIVVIIILVIIICRAKLSEQKQKKYEVSSTAWLCVLEGH